MLKQRRRNQSKHTNIRVIDHLKLVQKHLNAYKRSKSPENLHHLRVEIKKIRALNSFAKSINNKGVSIHDLKDLFDSAGKIRETQVNLKLVQKVPGFPTSIISRLKQNENKFKRSFIKELPNYFTAINNLRRHITPAPKPTKNDLRSFFNNATKKASKQFKKCTREDMHDFRKQIKKVMFVYKSLPERSQNNITINVKQIDKLQKLLGDWHDIYSFANFLSQQPRSKTLTKHIKLLKKNEKQEFDKLLNMKFKM